MSEWEGAPCPGFHVRQTRGVRVTPNLYLTKAFKTSANYQEKKSSQQDDHRRVYRMVGHKEASEKLVSVTLQNVHAEIAFSILIHHLLAHH